MVKELLLETQGLTKTYQAKKTINVINGVDYIKSVNSTSRGMIIELEKNYAGKLNHLLVKNNIQIEAMIPQNKTLEDSSLKCSPGFFFIILSAYFFLTCSSFSR